MCVVYEGNRPSNRMRLGNDIECVNKEFLSQVHNACLEP